MATWTNIPDTDIDANSPITEGLMFALRDNATAIAEGASGAPKIQNAAFTDSTISGSKIINGTLSLGKFGASTLGATTNMQLLRNQTYTLPEGWYYIYSGIAKGYVQLYINSLWVSYHSESAVTTEAIFVYSDGSNARLTALANTGTYNFYIRKFS